MLRLRQLTFVICNRSETNVRKISDTTEEGIYARIDNNPNYMPVVVEKVGHLLGYGEIICIAHYGKQNGDAMADPDMEFVIVGGNYYPISYRNDYLCCQQDVFTLDIEGKPEKINKILQDHLTTFANHWLKNIADQQFCDRL